MASEQTGLLPTREAKARSTTFNPEVFRVVGITAALVMMAVGTWMTKTFVIGAKDKPSSIEDSYLYQMFHFNHTCFSIDFNPTKTFAALCSVVCTQCLAIFSMLSHERIETQFEMGNASQNLFTFSKWSRWVRVFGFLTFFMCFVNSPLFDPNSEIQYKGPFGSFSAMIADRGWRLYVLHYLPFFWWQFSLALMAIEQVWFYWCMDNIPYKNIFTGKVLKWYLYTICVVFIYYTLFILAFIFEFSVPLKLNVLWAKFIMFFYLFLTDVVPLVFAYFEWKSMGGSTPLELTYTVM